MSAGYVPLPVPCAGCGQLTPYEVGEGASYGEFLATALGDCFVRTCRRRSCVLEARASKGGRPVHRAVDGEPEAGVAGC